MGSQITKRSFLTTMAGASALSLPSLFGATGAAAADVVRFAQPSDGFLYLPIYIARAKGFFEQEGINADVVVFKGGAAALSAVISNGSDVYIGVPAIGMNAIAQGQPVKMFASVMTEYASNIVIRGDVAKKLGLTDKSPVEQRLAALKGLTIGITGPGAAPDLLLRHIAKTMKWNPDRDFEMTPLGSGPNMLAAFSQKRIDGYCLSSPTSTTGVVKYDGYQLLNLSAGEYAPLKGFLYISLIAKDPWLAANPDRSARIVRALWRGQKLLRENPAAAKEAVRGFFKGTEPAIFDAAWDENLPAFPGAPQIAADAIKANLDFIAEMEGKKLALDPMQTFTNAYADAAAKGLS
ncbi:MAG: ABC transporter substrate-binding protein [Bosea sp.]|uniref:ABC transporter substrate-binding protein n=1 Tax=Bosea sp. (in: a-proteobacteria) TaxID=1871050 RepID=UPI001AC66570|nr:ABC transporter substrate-binding protein [Bosea sp. (in: a-proteobacteria)]MBN9453922.1 ABC transporter substrate-binding protein [Bosea sp. (in: a-proteobacteria)]